MDRRNFLGSVIGAAFSTSFLARLETEPFQFEEKRIFPYRMAMTEVMHGHTLQACPIKDIVKTVDGWSFVAEPFDVRAKMVVQGAILLTREGKVIGQSKFSSVVPVNNGDQLKVQYTLSVGPGWTEMYELGRDEFVQVYMDRMKNKAKYL